MEKSQIIGILFKNVPDKKCEGKEEIMYRIAVLSDKKDRGRLFSQRVKKLGEEYGIFPVVETYEDPERFFDKAQEMKPDGVIIDLPGVAGLNAAEHLRSLCPGCGMIWCSDLDFSLQAYRLRAEYFILYPVCEEELREGLSLWFEGRGHDRKRREAVVDPAKAVTVNDKR